MAEDDAKALGGKAGTGPEGVTIANTTMVFEAISH